MNISRSIPLLLLPLLVVFIFSSGKEPNAYDINSLTYFTSSSAELSIVDHEELYTTYAASDHVDITDKYIWIRVDGRRFQNKKYLKIINKLLPKIEQYKKVNNHFIKIDSSGYEVPCNQRSLCHEHFILNIHHDLNYYRLSNPSIITNLRLNLLDESTLLRKNVREQMGFGIYYGVFLFFIILNTFLFIQIKDNAYLFNLSFTFLLAVSFAIYDGTLSSSLFTSYAVNTYVISRILFQLLLLIHLIFAYSFFSVRKKSKALRIIYSFTFYIQTLLVILSCIPLEEYYLYLNYASIYIFFFQVGMILLLIIDALRKKKNVNKKYLIAYFPVVTLVVAYLLKVSGFSLFKFSFNDILYTCISLLVIMLAVYIIDAFSSYREDAELRLKELTKIKNHNNLNLEKKINKETQYLQEQRKQRELKNKELIDSFRYAKRIQNSLLTNEVTIHSVLPSSFLMFEPKEILSTDFYWVTRVSTKNNPDSVLFCIGKPDQKGIPGTLINALILKTIRNSIHSQKLSNTARVFNYIQHRLDAVLARNGVNSKHSLLVGVYNNINQQLSFSGNTEMIEIIRDGMPVDKENHEYNVEEYADKYKSHEHGITLEKNDKVYLFTEGIKEAYNTKGKHYFLQYIMGLSLKPIEQQKRVMLDDMMHLKVNQRKDYTFIGIEI